MTSTRSTLGNLLPANQSTLRREVPHAVARRSTASLLVLAGIEVRIRGQHTPFFEN